MLSREVLAKVRRIEIGTRKKVGSLFAGNYTSIFRGQGMTFAEVRPYQPGDDVRRIDWNVSARSRDIYIKQYTEERELTICLVVDVSASQRFGSQKSEKLQLAAELAALFAFAAIKHNDRVALIAFSDRIEHFVPPKKGRSHVLRLISDIIAVKPAGVGTSWQSALAMAESVLKRKSVVIFISDFVGMPDVAKLRVFSKRHDVIPVWLTDPMEKELPNVGFMWVKDPETGEQRMIDTASDRVRSAYRERVRLEHRQVAQTFQKAGVTPVEIVNGTDYTKALLGYFRMRSRR
ncbi:MAG: DUF58 domain-containing protein [Deltaproteobacteria bacterium]|nr:DUF58 domain-containing protein [Deltaproteobacteria bacterium]